MHIPKPFKNPAYTKNATRRTQTLKTLLAREKERDKAVRERLKAKTDGGGVTEDVEMQDEVKKDEDEDEVEVSESAAKALEQYQGLDVDDIPSCPSVQSSCSDVSDLNRFLNRSSSFLPSTQALL